MSSSCQVVYDSGPQVAYSNLPPLALLNQDDKEVADSCRAVSVSSKYGMSWKARLGLCIALVVIVATAVGVGLGVKFTSQNQDSEPPG